MGSNVSLDRPEGLHDRLRRGGGRDEPDHRSSTPWYHSRACAGVEQIEKMIAVRVPTDYAKGEVGFGRRVACRGNGGGWSRNLGTNLFSWFHLDLEGSL